MEYKEGKSKGGNQESFQDYRREGYKTRIEDFKPRCDQYYVRAIYFIYIYIFLFSHFFLASSPFLSGNI